MNLDEITRIQPNNSAVLYIAHRLSKDDYRGTHLSQHNRYDQDRLHTIVTELRRSCKRKPKERLQIRTTDLSKRPETAPGEEEYADFCERVKRSIGSGTEDAMRKNYFVDLHRMGLIDRFNAQGLRVNPSQRGKIKWVALTTDGENFATTRDPLQRRFLFSAAIDRLLRGLVSTILELLDATESSAISIDEFMLIASAIEKGTSIELTIAEAAGILREFRSMPRTKQKAVVAAVKRVAATTMSYASKTDKRDFHNWRNESCQLFSLLGQTVYFEYLPGEDKLQLATSSTSPVNEVRRRRSSTEKARYFEEHGITRTLAFELHHIVPLGSSTSLDHFILLDDWRNLLYINAGKHAVVTQQGGAHVVLTAQGHDLELQAIGDSHAPVSLRFYQDVRYSPSKLGTMLAYNTSLNEV